MPTRTPYPAGADSGSRTKNSTVPLRDRHRVPEDDGHDVFVQVRAHARRAAPGVVVERLHDRVRDVRSQSSERALRVRGDRGLSLASSWRQGHTGRPLSASRRRAGSDPAARARSRRCSRSRPR
jgi:hypothetical protein